MRRVGVRLVALVAALGLLFAGCGGEAAEETTAPATAVSTATTPAATTTADATTTAATTTAPGGVVERSDLAATYPSVGALLAALDAGGMPCRAGSVEMGPPGEREWGSCVLDGGGEIRVQRVDPPISPVPPEPGELGSGEERPEVHQETCEHLGEALVLGPNWMVVADGGAVVMALAGILGGYPFVADCDGLGVEEICDRAAFSGPRVFVTVSAAGLSVDPPTVPVGKAWFCYRSEAPGRLAISEFTLDDSVDVAALLAKSPVLGAELLATPGVYFDVGMQGTVGAGNWVGGGSMELAAGLRLLHGGLVAPDAPVGSLPDDIVGYLGLLTVGG